MIALGRLSKNTQAALCLVAALVCLTLSDSIIKWLSPVLPLHQITLFRSIIAILLLLAFVSFGGGLRLLRTRRPLMHFTRGLTLVLANMFFFLALAAMPLAETVTLFYTAPLFICILSQPVLGEKVGLSRWFVIAMGMIGVIIMLRPGSELFRIISLLPVCAALCYAAMTMMTRKLGLHDTAGALTFYIQLSFIVVSSLVGLALGDGRFDHYDSTALSFLLRAWVWPDTTQLQLLIVCGSIMSIGGFLISQAYRIGEASAVAPFEYASLPFALVVGYYLWGDWPDWSAFIGTGLIIGSGLLVLYLENRAQLKTQRHVQIDY